MTEPANPRALAIEDLTRSYGQNLVLDRVSLGIDGGEIFGLIGLNGAGKTTLIKSILDLAAPDGGEVRLFGRNARHADARAAVSYLPEMFQPSALLTGWDFLSLTLAYFDQRLDRGAAADMARALALDPARLKARVGTYSKGIAQKLGLVGALLPARPLVILDEPMSGLDPEARVALKRVLVGQAADGRAVFFSSHGLSDIDEICHRVGVLHDRKMRFVGTVAAFHEAYPAATLEQAFLTAIAA